MGMDCAGLHVCEPGHWPTSLDETWTCPECGRAHVAFRSVDEERLCRMIGISDTLGWRSFESDDA